MEEIRRSAVLLPAGVGGSVGTGKTVPCGRLGREARTEDGADRAAAADDRRGGCPGRRHRPPVGWSLHHRVYRTEVQCLAGPGAGSGIAGQYEPRRLPSATYGGRAGVAQRQGQFGPGTDCGQRGTEHRRHGARRDRRAGTGAGLEHRQPAPSGCAH